MMNGEILSVMVAKKRKVDVETRKKAEEASNDWKVCVI